MKRPTLLKLLFILLCIALTALAVQGDILTEPEGELQSPQPQDTPAPSIFCAYYDSTIVRQHISAAAADEAYKNIPGAVVPHYAPGMYMLADILSSISEAPDTIVVVAPNHTAAGAQIQVCGEGYHWADGSIPGNPDIAASIAAYTGLDAAMTTDAASEDWSASLMMPYLAHYFPKANVVTLMLTRGIGYLQVSALADCLAELSKTENIFVLGSVDFSHYQSPQAAAQRDDVTQKAIAELNYSTLLTLDNSYLDSPETLCTLLRYGALLERSPEQSGRHFEVFPENGKLLAGSYYAYILT